MLRPLIALLLALPFLIACAQVDPEVEQDVMETEQMVDGLPI